MRDIEATIAALAPPNRDPIYIWARDNVEMPPAYTITGRFNPDISRHFQGPFDALRNHRIRRVVVLKPTRGGGSLIGDVMTAWIVDNDPGPMMINMQTDAIAHDHAEERIIPLLRGCSRTAALLPEDTRKVCSDGMTFTNGMPLHIQGPSIGNLQSKGIRWQWNDEVWIWPPGRLGQALARLDDFDRMQSSKALVVSQGGVEGSEWHAIWEESSQQEWLIPCLKCGAHQTPEFGGRRPDGSRYGMVWSATDRTHYPDGRHNVGEILATMRWECKHCGHPHTDARRTQAEWNRLGKYEPQNLRNNPTVEGFHWHGLIFRDWTKLVTEFLKAQDALKSGDINPLRDFVQKDEAKFWSDTMVTGAKVAELSSYESDWKDEKLRFLTVDCQDEGVFWFVVRAWALTGESRRLAFGKIYSWSELEAIQTKFKVAPNHVLIDSGFLAKQVYYQCVKHGWIALKGEDNEFFLHPIKRNGKLTHVRRSYSQPAKGDPERGEAFSGRRYAVLIRWSNPTVKDHLRPLRDGRGAPWLLGAGQGANASDADYNEQMTSEYKRRQKSKKTGRDEMIWYHGSKPNHIWDCECMQDVGARLARCILERDEVDIAPAAEPTNPTLLEPSTV
jgi:hypothetical protein